MNEVAGLHKRITELENKVKVQLLDTLLASYTLDFSNRLDMSLLLLLSIASQLMNLWNCVQFAGFFYSG